MTADNSWNVKCKNNKYIKKQFFPSLKLIVRTGHQKLVEISKRHVIYHAKILQDTEGVVEWGGLT